MRFLDCNSVQHLAGCCVMSRRLSTGKPLPKVTSTAIGTNPRFSGGAVPTCLNIKLQMDLYSGLKTISIGNIKDGWIDK